MQGINTFSDEAMHKIADDHTRLIHEVLNLRRLLARQVHSSPASPSRGTRVRFTNTTGADIPAYACMRVTLTTTTRGVPVWTADKPNTTFCNRYLVNGSRKALNNGGGFGTWLDDAAYVLCDSTYVPTIGQEWGPTSGSWALVRHRPGFLIDGGPTGSGATYRAVAKQRIVTTLLGKADGSAVVDTGTFTTSVWMRNAATGTMEDSGYDIATCLAWGAAVTSGKKVAIELHGGQWIGGMIQC